MSKTETFVLEMLALFLAYSAADVGEMPIPRVLLMALGISAYGTLRHYQGEKGAL